ncbi:MAG: M24 family metallopeptidase [Solirubrobacteraceae bacterium]
MTTDRTEIERRIDNARRAAADAGADALLVCGSEYTGFEGAVFYLSGFRILHRYAYVLVGGDDDPVAIFPGEGRWVGEHGESWLSERAFADVPGKWIADRCAQRGWKRLGVYGMEYAMPVRDYRALAASDAITLVSCEETFDLARAVKSEAELQSVRASMAINEDGFRAVLEAWEPGRSETDLMAAAEQAFFVAGTGRLTMDMVLTGKQGAALPEMRLPDPARALERDDMLLYGLEVAGRGGHWVEFSRPISGGSPSEETQAMLEAYRQHREIARTVMRAGATSHEVHNAVSEPFRQRGWHLGHVTGHSIGMTMIEHPRIGDGIDVELRADMICSMHPHVISDDERTCLYMQDTWHVGPDGARPLSEIPIAVFDGASGQPLETA